jgi:alkanesulfonate monooxygenase SsuD/methylene tetrahydromethanopterin reductase-like flavin-dependent oxidoreductase (luciferase family)
MEIGIGMPNAVPGTSGEQIIEFARRAEARGFSTLGALDRVVYDSHEPLTAFAAAGAVTERIELTTAIVVGPPRANDVLLAKQAATVQALSGGRLTLGIGLGARDDDYEASGVPTSGKGRRLDRQLETIKRVWSGEEFGFAGAVGPQPDAPPQILVGGSVEASFRRAAKYGAGWIMGGGTPDQFAEGAEGVRSAWSEAGREGAPRLESIGYFALGPDAEATAKKDLGHYYAWLGEEMAGMIAGSAATSEEMVGQYMSAFEDAGCQRLTLFATSADAGQVDLLADAAGL